MSSHCFGPAFTAPPRLIGALASYKGFDSSTVRYDEDSLGAESVQVYVQEDTSDDGETGHNNPEMMSYLAIEGSGVLSATKASDWITQTSGLGQPTTLVSGTVIRRSTYELAGQPVALRVTTIVSGTETESDLYHLHLDHLGSVAILSDYGDGSVVSATLALHEPFGAYRLSPTASPTDRSYTGHRENSYIKLIDMKARWYDPAIGRFISPDSIVPDPTNPQSFNRYNYALSNPLRYTDPSGHCVDGITTWACIAAGVAAVTKVVDWGWTLYDSWQSGQTLADPSASRGDRMMAALNIGVSALFELVEPDDIFPVGLPIDDIARRTVLRGAYEALEAGGDEALEAFVRDQFGDHADEVLERMWSTFCSFSGNTVVMTEDGLVPISEVELQDKVLAYDEETGEIGYYPVTAVWEHLDPIIVTLTIAGEQIETTPEHPFYAVTGNWLPAADLQVGDRIRSAEWETGTVEAIQLTIDPQPMYNFTVAVAHTYFVGDGQWLVHNACKLKLLHGDDVLNKSTLDFWGQKSTEDIVDSLLTKGDEHLRIRPDGTVLQVITGLRL